MIELEPMTFELHYLSNGLQAAYRLQLISNS